MEKGGFYFHTANNKKDFLKENFEEHKQYIKEILQAQQDKLLRPKLHGQDILLRSSP